MKFAPISRFSSLVLVSLALGIAACGAESGELVPLEEADLELAMGGVTLKTTVVPRFLGATNGGGSTVVATATVAQGYEAFTLDDLNGGTLEGGDIVTIRTASGRYFRALNGGGSALDATATTPQGWETFTIVKASGSGTIKNGDVIGLRASSGAFVRAVNGGGAAVDVQGAALSTWEQFTVAGLPSAPTGADPSCSTGIRNGAVCCPASCGACGGSGCGSRPGGTSACCTGPVTTANVSCSGSVPPCVVTSVPDGSIPSNPSRPPNTAQYDDGRGAVVPWVEYEAEGMATNGTLLGPSRSLGQVASEASGRKAVRLGKTGQFVRFRSAYAANSLVVRYSIPDGGENYWTTLSLYVDGVLQSKLSLTSRYSWTYGTEYQFNSPDQNNPSLGSPHHFFDEARALALNIPAGAEVMLRKDASDGASYYDVDLVDLEQVSSPLAQPGGSLHLVSDCGAVPNDGRDDATAIQSCMDRARGEKRGVYIPPGVFHSFSKVISVAGVTVKGAGMWHSTISGFNASFDCWADGCRYSDFAILGDSVRRIDTSPETAFRGNGQSGSVLERVWVEHTKAGMFAGPNASGVVVRDSRFRSLFADAINLWAGTSNAIVENNHVRGSGDDAFASWADTASSGVNNANNVFRHNFVQAPWKANCFGIYGGNATRIEDNVCADVVQYPGILLARQFASHPFAGATRIERNTLIRAGGPLYGQQHGALKFHADAGPIAGVVVTNLRIVEPTYSGVHVQGPGSSSNISLSDVSIESPTTSAFLFNGGGSGSLFATNVVVSGAPVGVRNDSGFSLQRGPGNSGF